MTWPAGAVPFSVEELIAAGRALDDRPGEPVAAAAAREVVAALAAYVASLAPVEQATTARALIARLTGPLRFEATVKPRRPEPRRPVLEIT